MADAHVCDNCLTVAPIGEAVGWWRVESHMPSILVMGQKPEYDFCSWRCITEYGEKHKSTFGRG
jgi:hypothetical protein